MCVHVPRVPVPMRPQRRSVSPVDLDAAGCSAGAALAVTAIAALAAAAARKPRRDISTFFMSAPRSMICHDTTSRVAVAIRMGIEYHLKGYVARPILRNG